ncbi:catalytic activity protein [[Candida] boidinii]|nr:catalytic activity protein [[Candida] boidinii]
MDVTTAFLNGDLAEEIYMNQPDGYVDASQPHKVCRLIKSLYGLKQAPLCWNTKINSVLEAAGFVRAPSDLGIYSFSRNSSVLLLALYVDDLLLLSNDASLVSSAKSLLGSHFSMKDLGAVKSFLGMDVCQEPGRVSLSLSRYLYKVLVDFNMSDCNPVTVPLSPSLDL